MKQIQNLKDWQLDGSVPKGERNVDVKICIKYPDAKQFIKFKPKDRIKKINQYHEESLNKLFSLNLFKDYKILGTEKRPQGVATQIKFEALKTISKLDFITAIIIENVDHAKNLKVEAEEKPIDNYFCVKMTAIIEVEGVSSKKQKVEQRFVIIKADSCDDAYQKLERQKDSYAEPYLNSDGRFVRWRIDTFDDCYETDIHSPADLDNPEGVEVYSKLKSRKTKNPNVWDGKF